MEKVDILLADNQELTCNGISAILVSKYKEALNITKISTKEDLVKSISAIKPRVLIIDFELIDITDISEIRGLCKSNPEIGILVVSDNKSPNIILKVIDCGIKNYVLKSCEADELLEAFKATLANKKYFCSEIMDIILDQKTAHKPISDIKALTSSEIGIVKLITQGLTTKEIALQKNLSFHTIITHRKNIFRKLGISNTSELLMYAMRAGIIDTTEYYI